MTTSQNRRPRMAIILTVIGALVAAGITALALYGVLPFTTSSTYPPCDQLPTLREAREALTTHPDLAATLEAQGDTIRVQVATPCTETPDAALIEVHFASKQERDAIEDVLNKNTGFGVPVHVTDK